jgi:UDP-N-acetylglucosamine 2-epimerase (non-hydrolysing)
MAKRRRRIRALLIVGTRPDAVKLAPVIQELRRRRNRFEIRICVTSQHGAMLRHVLRTFAIKPDYDLRVMRPGQDLFALTSRVLRGMRLALDGLVRSAWRPDVALVHGDTTTALAAALACYYGGVPVAHVEAGLRSFDKRQPFPEEINRRIIDVIADVHYAPTATNRAALIAERVPPRAILVTGNTVVDALASRRRRMRSVSTVAWPSVDPHAKLILVTCHRRESFGPPIRGICNALKRLVALEHDVAVVYPVHRNPQVASPVRQLLTGVDRVRLVPPLNYERFLALMEGAFLILTDSGGVQEEAPCLSKPILVMRNVTERPEGIEAGAALLVGTDPDRIVSEVRRLLHDRRRYDRMARARNPYGDGHAARRIADDLQRRFGAALRSRVSVQAGRQSQEANKHASLLGGTQ